MAAGFYVRCVKMGRARGRAGPGEGGNEGGGVYRSVCEDPRTVCQGMREYKYDIMNIECVHKHTTEAIISSLQLILVILGPED